MARRNEDHIIRTYRTVARASLGLIVPPLILIPAFIWGFFYINERITEGGNAPLTWEWLAVPIVFLLLFPLWAKFKAWAFSRYRVTLDSVVEEHGLFSKSTSEIRVQDIRNIVVNQTFLERILFYGSVSFSSAAGTDVEVNFPNVSRPKRIRDLVRDIQARRSDGDLSAADIKAIRVSAFGEKVVAREEAREAERANAADARKQQRAKSEDDAPTDRPALEEAPLAPAPTRPASEPAPAPAAEPAAADDGDELYRLLAQQAAEGKTEQ